MDSAFGLPAMSPDPDAPGELSETSHASPGEPDKLHSASTPVDVARPLSRQKVSASLEKLLGAGLSPTGRPSSYGSRERSSSREGLSSSGDELSPARETRDMDLASSRDFDRTNATNRSSVFEESWNPLEDEDERPARPKSCDALSAGSLPLTSSDSRSRDELVGTGLDSTEDELDSGIMDDDLPVEMRRRHRSLSDRSSSRSLEDQLDLACVESGPRLSSEGMRHRIQLTKQSVKNRRKPTRAGRRSHEHSQHSAIQEVTPQRDSLDPSLLSRGTTPPISPSILRKTSPSPRPRQTPPTTPGRSPVPSPRPTPPATRARLGRDHSPSTPEEHVVKSASSPAVSLDTVQPETSPTLLPSVGASMSPVGVSMTPPSGPLVTPPAAQAAPLEPSPVMTPPGIVTSSLTSRPRSAAEPLVKDDGFMSELKRRTASKEDLTSPRPLTPRKAVLPAISPSHTQPQKIDGAVTDETKDSLSPEPKSNQKPKFDTSPSKSADIRTKPASPRSQTPDLKPKAKPKPNLPPKSSSPTWFDKLRLRKKAASIDVPEPEVETKTKSPEPKVKGKSTEATSTVTVVQPVAQKATDGKDASQGGTPPWLRETRLRRSASKSDEKKESSEPKPSWMREVLARRRKTQEKLNVGDLAEPEKSPQEKSTPKKTLSPLKTNTESDNKNNNMDKTAKNNKNIVSKTLFKENREKDRDFDSGTSSCEQSPLRRPTSLQKRDENVPPPSTVTSSATTTTVTSQSSRTSSATEVTPPSSSIAKTSPLPPISKAPSAAGEREIDTSVPAWKAELAIRKSQRKISVPKPDSDQPSAEVPQWKRELMEKKRARSVPQEEDPSLAGLPPWKQELMRKKKERSSPNCGMIDAQQDQSQC